MARHKRHITGRNDAEGAAPLNAWSSPALAGSRSALQTLEQVSHSCVQTPSDHLQRDDPDLPLALLDVRYVSSVHIQANSHVGLSPSFLLSQQTDALSNLN